MRTRVSLKYSVNNCLWKRYFALYPFSPLQISFFGNFGNFKAIHTVLTPV